MMTVTIEAARREHLAAIPAIEIAAARMFPETDLPLAMRYLVTEVETLQVARKQGRLWMALLKTGKPVGFALADTVDGNAHLDQMDVHPEYGRRGIGTRLLQHFIEYARKAKFRQATLVTFRHLPWNAPFYERLGFAAVQPAEIGVELAALLHAEARAGLDADKRIGMRLELAMAH